MGTPYRDRQRRPGRRVPFRQPRPLILIVCEGTNTEPQYFESCSLACHNPRVKVHIAPEHGVPISLVEAAKERMLAARQRSRKEKDENLAYDQVWCVFDVDDHPRVGEAKEMARANGIHVAVSNPCFELWLLLHFRDNPGPQTRGKIVGKLRKFVPEYEKDVDYATYANGRPEAEKRAARMDATANADNDAGRNPTTGVFRLTEVICAVEDDSAC